MKSGRILPAFCAAAGIIGAVLRGINLYTGYEPTGLPIPGNAAQIMLIALSCVFLIAAFVFTRGLADRRGTSFEVAFSCGSAVYKLIAVLAGLAMAGAGVTGLYQLIVNPPQPSVFLANQSTSTIATIVPMLILWVLAILTMVSFITLASAQSGRNISEGTAFLSIIPMFWACFDLIITFKDNGSSPFVALYSFELFAAIALMFAFYAIAGFLYSISNPARFLFTASLAIYFTLTTVGGYFIYTLLGGGVIDLSFDSKLRYLCFFAAAVYLFANLCLANTGLRKKQTASMQTAQE